MSFKAFFTSKKPDLFNLLPDGLLIVSRDGKIIDVNNSAVNIFKMHRHNIVGEYVSKFFQGGSSLLNDIIKGKKSEVSKVLSRQDEEIYVDITASMNEENEEVYVSLREVSEKYIRDKARKAEYDILKSINDEKNIYLTTNSTEILSFASSIESFSRALLNGVAGMLMAKQEKYLGIINKNANDLLYNLEKYFDLLKMESDLWKTNYKTFDIVTLLNDKAEKYKLLFKNKKVRFEYNFDNIQTRTCYLDFTIIDYIVENLLQISYRNLEVGSCVLNVGNPPKLFLENKKMDVEPKSYILFELKDSSSTFTDEELNILFDSYKMAKGVRMHSMGVKMAFCIIKKLLIKMGGDIWVYSKPTVGSMITFVIPVERMIQKI